MHEAPLPFYQVPDSSVSKQTSLNTSIFQTADVPIPEHQPYLAAELLHIIIFVVDIFSVKIDMSVGSTDQSVHMLHQRGFTGTGMPDNTDELSIRYL